MKRKLSSILLAAALMVSLSVPAFAANCQTPAVRSACLSDVLQQIILQYNCGSSSGSGGNSRTVGQQIDLNTLLSQLLTQYRGAAPETPGKQSGTPSKAETPAKQETPAQAETPSKADTSAKQETPTQSATPTENAGSSVRAYEQEVVRLVNVERAKYGLAALAEDAALTRTARMKSQDMRDKGYFDHNSPTYGTPFQLMKSQGITYRTAGENIAMGYATPQAVVNAWMNSAGHRANILNASYTKIGVGYVANGHYWTQHFTG